MITGTRARARAGTLRQDRHAAHYEQRPWQDPATALLRESASGVVETAAIIPSTEDDVSAAIQPG